MTPKTPVPTPAKALPYDLIEALPGRVGYVQRIRVFHRALQRTVEFRLLPKEAPERHQEAFLRELRELSGLDHPSFLPVLERGGVRGRHCYSVPLREHPTLDEWLRQEGLTPVDVVWILRDLASSLASLHSQGWMSGPLDPRLIAYDQVQGRAYHLHHVSGSRETFSRIWGRFPEDVQDLSSPGPEKDLYFWGALGYLLLTQGTWPPDAKALRDSFLAHAAPLPEGLRLSLWTCLNEDPAERPKSAIELDRVLRSEGILGAGLEALPEADAPPSALFRARLDLTQDLETKISDDLPYPPSKVLELADLPQLQASLEESSEEAAGSSAAPSEAPRLELEEPKTEPHSIDFEGVELSEKKARLRESAPPKEPPEPRSGSFGLGLSLGLLLGAGLALGLSPRTKLHPRAKQPRVEKQASLPRPKRPSPKASTPPSGPVHTLAPSQASGYLESPRIQSLLLARRVTPESFPTLFRRIRDLTLASQLPPELGHPPRVLALRVDFRNDAELGCRNLEAWLEELRATLGVSTPPPGAPE